MSTSPSWFDQEKFSRLVKKKTAPKPSPAASIPGGSPVVPRGPQAIASVPPRRGSGTLPVIPSRATTGPLPTPRSGPLPPSAVRPATSTLGQPPLTRTGGVSTPMPSTRPATGPLPSLARSSAPLPAAGRPSAPMQPIAAKKQSGSILPPPPKQSGPLAAASRSTAHLPPPPLRDPSGRLPLPRSQTGRLPFPAAGETSAARSTEEAPLKDLPTPETPAIEPKVDEPKAEPATPPVFTPPVTPPVFTPPLPFKSETVFSPAPERPPAPIRSTMPMPDIKPLFEDDDEDVPAATSTSGIPKVPDLPPELLETEDDGESLTDESLTVEQLREQTGLLARERDQAQAELEIARGQGGIGASDDKLVEDIASVTSERDEARMEVIVLRNRIESAEEKQRDTDAMASQLEELSHVIDERDSVRRDYASLREQFETLKLDRSQLDSNEETEQLKAEIHQLREQASTGAAPAPSAPPAAADGDSAALREQLKSAKDEATLAQRGLALSQRALQDTREALKEATDGTSTSKGSLEEAKKERSGLQRQNQLLQGQIDQLTRDLSASKAKLAAKGV